jgi:competence protein ComEC
MVRWVDAALNRDPHAVVVGAGDSIRWSGPSLAVLWPDGPDGRGLNRHSLVLQVNPGGATALIMGDAGAAVERRLLERGALPTAVDVLVAGHHGSKATASSAFLDRVAPRFVLVSVNRDNIRGYPAATAISRLESAAARLWRSDHDGERCLRLADGRATVCP